MKPDDVVASGSFSSRFLNEENEHRGKRFSNTKVSQLDLVRFGVDLNICLDAHAMAHI